jgi:hypothetical protein
MSKKIPAVLGVALFTGLSITVAAQSQPGAPAAPAAPAAQAAQPTDTIRVTGCLKNEKDVAGLKPNVAERAGITEDYILTDVKLAADSKSAIGLATMYEIEGISEGDLKAHLNHQIEVTGQLSKVETGAAATTASNRGDVPDFKATSFKMVSPNCTAKN